MTLCPKIEYYVGSYVENYVANYVDKYRIMY